MNPDMDRSRGANALIGVNSTRRKHDILTNRPLHVTDNLSYRGYGTRLPLS
jgi:hypothetical protein